MPGTLAAWEAGHVWNSQQPPCGVLEHRKEKKASVGMAQYDIMPDGVWSQEPTWWKEKNRVQQTVLWPPQWGQCTLLDEYVNVIKREKKGASWIPTQWLAWEATWEREGWIEKVNRNYSAHVRACGEGLRTQAVSAEALAVGVCVFSAWLRQASRDALTTHALQPGHLWEYEWLSIRGSWEESGLEMERSKRPPKCLWSKGQR